MPNIVHIVHCIDTEGPLHESVEATFERLRDIFRLDLQPSLNLLRRLQAGEVNLGGIEHAVRKVVDPHLLKYNDTWDKVDAMLEDAMSESFRTKFLDSQGRGWIYNWFCVDHVDYDTNPRRRDLGFHNIFDHYRSIIRDFKAPQDGLHFHFHPHNFRREAHRSATHWWANSSSLQQTLSKRVIERQWFPAAHRAGFHVIRPESHWFLEQFIPFDFSSQAISSTQEDQTQSDIMDGRFGDWRRAPDNWKPYHPAHDDYQVPGRCRRWNTRCLNIGTRFNLLTEKDVRQAFNEAMDGQPVVLAFTNHDFRDLRPDVDAVRNMVSMVAADFPEVLFRYSEAIEAMRHALALSPEPPCELEISLNSVGDSKHVLEVESKTPSFGPQPWLALKTSAGTFHYDNFDIETPFHRWQYVFDEQTYRLNALIAVGVAVNNSIGITTVATLDPASGKVNTTYLNMPVK